MELPDEATPFGNRVRERLRGESVAWLTTTADRMPQPNPVWFICEGAPGSHQHPDTADMTCCAIVRMPNKVAITVDKRFSDGGPAKGAARERPVQPTSASLASHVLRGMHR